jgi:hypothetical protein
VKRGGQGYSVSKYSGYIGLAYSYERNRFPVRPKLFNKFGRGGIPHTVDFQFYQHFVRYLSRYLITDPGMGFTESESATLNLAQKYL